MVSSAKEASTKCTSFPSLPSRAQAPASRTPIMSALGKRKASSNSTVHQVGESCSVLTANPVQLDILRANFARSVNDQTLLVRRMRNEIPDCHSHIERNALQKVTDRLLRHIMTMDDIIRSYMDNEIKQIKRKRSAKGSMKQRKQRRTN